MIHLSICVNNGAVITTLALFEVYIFILIFDQNGYNPLVNFASSGRIVLTIYKQHGRYRISDIE